ncbi:MAG TPA: rhomboid family intramembrane serine protease [Actinomycetes bacterium]|nr:rhomboid family intramembrane serine protease [Actinomycetes bacterium]
MGIIAACLIVWIFYELPNLNSSVREASFDAWDVDGSCDSSLPWTVSWFTAMFMHASWGHLLGNMSSTRKESAEMTSTARTER